MKFTLDAIASSAVVDLDGDIIETDSYSVDEMNDRSIPIFSSHVSGTTIGFNEDWRLRYSAKAQGNVLAVSMNFDDHYVNGEESQKGFDNAKSGAWDCTSIGFQSTPADYDVMKDKSGNFQGLRFKKIRILELSICAIGSNPLAKILKSEEDIAIMKRVKEMKNNSPITIAQAARCKGITKRQAAIEWLKSIEQGA
ncbi:HK97 family phage prohead protease [Vibrio algicola]|uniref:Prohead serine protease domain-containing protein n=1 Tax=Vibrio algicola TaxID=2662262 RepID=A0A5Q0TD27_9VIBR|nr:HK97 family phage prohead protease [Vibrio algicola]